MIAVCLLTCNRPELTAVTVRSFLQHNQGRDFALLHCDGGSESMRNLDIAADGCFRTLMYPHERVGQLACLHRFLEETQDCEWLLWLENDWESVAPMPSEDFIAESEADTIRLFGDRKFRDGKRANAGPHRIGTSELIEWEPAMDGWERGRAHWGAGGTLIRREVLERQAANARRLKDAITANVHLSNLRPRENIMWSIGHETTEGFIG